MPMLTRKVSDCRKMPGEHNCTVSIAGTEEEVVPLAAYHAVTTHGEKDTPELSESIRNMLEDEK